MALERTINRRKSLKREIDESVRKVNEQRRARLLDELCSYTRWQEQLEQKHTDCVALAYQAGVVVIDEETGRSHMVSSTERSALAWVEATEPGGAYYQRWLLTQAIETFLQSLADDDRKIADRMLATASVLNELDAAYGCSRRARKAFLQHAPARYRAVRAELHKQRKLFPDALIEQYARVKVVYKMLDWSQRHMWRLRALFLDGCDTMKVGREQRSSLPAQRPA